MSYEESKIPQYRIGREASGEEFHQLVKNVLRRMLFLPIVRTSEQAKQEAIRKLRCYS